MQVAVVIVRLVVVQVVAGGLDGLAIQGAIGNIDSYVLLGFLDEFMQTA